MSTSGAIHALDPFGGALLFVAFLAIFGLLSLLLSWISSRGLLASKSQFLVADRKLGLWQSSFSIGASWIWAPALFVSAEKAYTDGIIGFGWFLVPNVLCLILFAFFAVRVRQEMPLGFTLSDYIRARHSKRVQSLYWVTLVGLTVCAFAVQLLAGGATLAQLSGLPFFWVTVLLAAVPLSYSLFFGLRASVVTDLAKIILIMAIGFALIPHIVSQAGGISTVIRGLSGQIGTTDLFSTQSSKIFMSFGLPVTLGLMSGPFGDQVFWQRAFATETRYVKRSFFFGALIFAVVPILLSFLGFVAAGAGFKVQNPQLVNLETVLHYPPKWLIVPFVVLILSGLVSILDSKLMAISSIGGHDWLNRLVGTEDAPYSKVLSSSRWSMILLAGTAILIANIPGLKIVHLFLFYGTIRSATLLPTILTVLRKDVSEAGMFWGILFSVLVGLPVFGYGNFFSKPVWSVTGSLLTVFTSGIVVWTCSICADPASSKT